MKTWLKGCSVILLISVSAIAEEAVYLTKGQPSPYEGFLIDKPKAQKYALMDVDLTSCTKIQGLQMKQLAIMDDRLANLNTENKNLSERVVSDSSVWGKIGMFLLGAGAATLITYSVNHR